MTPAPTPTLKRRDVYQGALVDGRVARNGTSGRLRRRLQELLVSKGEREEAELERRIRTLPGVTRPNTVALISPKGGVGKTTNTFLVGNLLATHLKLRVVAVDANPDFGTLARLSPDQRRCERSLADLLDDADGLKTAAELNPYISRQATGLHVLAAPRDAELTANLGPDRYGELIAFLSCFYEVVLLDLGTGVAGPLARFAIDRADQAVLVTTPDWVTSSVVLDALAHVQHEHTTVALNKSLLKAKDLPAVEQRFRAEHLHRCVTIPFDSQLAATLDTGSYTLGALRRATRLAIKHLGLAVAEQLV
jgi:MinD-like ATPase involved in chromosome partitioning or flagellar assembly